MSGFTRVMDEIRYPANHTRLSRARYFMARFYDENCKKTQCDYLLEYLERYNSITPMEALNAFNCFRLGARVSDLRADGYDIQTEINPKGKRYAIYRYYPPIEEEREDHESSNNI